MYLRLLHTAEYLYKHRITITKKSGPGYRVRQIRSWLEFKFLKYILESSTGTKSAKRILSQESITRSVYLVLGVVCQPFCVDKLNPAELISVRAKLPIYLIDQVSSLQRRAERRNGKFKKNNED